MSDKSIEQGKKNLEKFGKNTQFSGSRAAEAGRKGGIATGVAKRKKNASRAFLKEILTYNVKLTPTEKATLIAMGGDPDAPITLEQAMVIAMAKKARAGDLRAYDMVHEYLAEDPHTQLEEKRIQAQQEAFKAIRNSDGFMAAMGAVAEEVLEDGGDTPDTLEDSE